ncbi:carboxylesterase-mitochondrial 37S ribosomal protein YmS2 [Hanseniaspora uvarum]|nr:carboxylesterase-mitochondrial 37S ribosomal protein YmS2 [Hanseniaspora uvarum]
MQKPKIVIRMGGDEALLERFHKQLGMNIQPNPKHCTRLSPNLSENEIVEEYEKMKKATYKTTIKLGVQPNPKDFSTLVFRTDVFNKNLTYKKDDIAYNVNCYIPENLTDLLSETSTAKNIPVYFGVHGAGSSSYTFNSVCSYLKEINPSFVFIAIDLRGHGETKSSIKIPYNLKDFVSDTNFLVYSALKDIFGETLNKKVSIVFVGHSLGGSVCSSLLHSVKLSNGNDMNNYWKNNILGLVMLDIIEDLAVSSLEKMPDVIRRSINKFPNIKQCMNWHLGTGNPRNFESAKFSVLDLYSLKHLSDDKYYLERKSNLSDFQNYWNTWFTGLSDQFINLKGVSKALILSGNEQRTQNLDKSLMIGQMQGKYQLVVFNDGGHFVHEDCDFKVAITLEEFVKRNDNKLVEIKTNWGKS